MMMLLSKESYIYNYVIVIMKVKSGESGGFTHVAMCQVSEITFFREE